jgi:leader peptidase (prepilin peptidase)/N-methyltransferase
MLTAAVLLWMAALTGYDVRQCRLPNRLTLPGFAAVMLVAAGSGHGLAAALGAAALTTVYLLVHLLAPTAMGAGDVKLALGLGALTGCFGADVWLLAAIGWSATTVPHGPSMCLASAAALGLAQLT